ncbi:hypothetical protein AB4369_28530, partial [Vibrio sp. 10N.261.49.A5]
QKVQQLLINEGNKTDEQPQTKDVTIEQKSYEVQESDTQPNLEVSNSNTTQHRIPIQARTVNKEN